MRFSIVVADDEGQYLKKDGSMENALRRQLAELCLPNVDVDIVFPSSRDKALVRCKDQTEPIGLLLVDIMWMIHAAEEDGAEDLLKAGSARPETTVLVLSRESKDLLRYLYSTHYEAFRPHAALYRGHVSLGPILRGCISAAFSQSRMPLRSLGADVSFVDSFRNGNVVKAPINATVLSELACMAANGLTSARVLTLSGGLSGVLLVAVEAQLMEAGEQIARSFILKVSEGPRELTSEKLAHTRQTLSFPTGRFARPTSDDIWTFGGWSALSLEYVDGVTAESAGLRVLRPETWRSIFSRALLVCYQRNSHLVSMAVGSWVASEQGLLGGDRWARLLSAARSLNLPDEDLVRLQKGVASLLAPGTRQSARTIVHGDLHWRNVMIEPSGHTFWIDAASIRTSGLWCEDIARFSVWVCCGLLDVRASLSDQIDRIRQGLRLDQLTIRDRWVSDLAARISETLELQRSIFADANVEINIEADWGVVVRAELFRAAYSDSSFSDAVREAALKAALKV